MNLFNFEESFYLCYKEIPTIPFKCQEFKSFQEADNYFRENIRKNNEGIVSTMFPIKSFTPRIIRPYLINSELSRMFISHEIITVWKPTVCFLEE